jgi:hypothetical protein
MARHAASLHGQADLGQHAVLAGMLHLCRATANAYLVLLLVNTITKHGGQELLLKKFYSVAKSVMVSHS